jgi:hypothetical protein
MSGDEIFIMQTKDPELVLPGGELNLKVNSDRLQESCAT